jgi:hypothetical protein
MNSKLALFLSLSACAALTGCNREGELVGGTGIGVTATRTGCPVVAVPDGTGDVTLFNPANSRDASAIDVVASISNVRSTCNSSGETIYSEATFDVRARRSDARGNRAVTLPYYSTVVQGGSAVVAKRIGNVTLQFADGQYLASGTAKAAGYVKGDAARLPADIIAKINKKRKPGDPDAALDPLADPEVKAALIRTSFELLVGFQLTEEQLSYNVTR